MSGNGCYDDTNRAAGDERWRRGGWAANVWTTHGQVYGKESQSMGCGGMSGKLCKRENPRSALWVEAAAAPHPIAAGTGVLHPRQPDRQTWPAREPVPFVQTSQYARNSACHLYVKYMRMTTVVIARFHLSRVLPLGLPEGIGRSSAVLAGRAPIPCGDAPSPKLSFQTSHIPNLLLG